MSNHMAVEDAINVVQILGCELASDGDEDVGKLVSTAIWLVSHVQEQALELERERARGHGIGRREATTLEGHRLENGADGGGRRDFLAARGVHSGETFTCSRTAAGMPLGTNPTCRATSHVCTCRCRVFERTWCFGSNPRRGSRGRRNCGSHRDSER
jgi:hypothetical protein